MTGGCSAKFAYFGETLRKIAIFRLFLRQFRRTFRKIDAKTREKAGSLPRIPQPAFGDKPTGILEAGYPLMT